MRKVKINWGTGIVIAIGAFVVFILSFVYKATFNSKYEHHLVSENYYKDELNYQQEIDKLDRAAKLKNNIRLEKTNAGLVIVFPSEFDVKKIKGTIDFQRLSNDKLDFNRPIELETAQYLIKDADLVSGKWKVKIDWKYEEKSYLFKQNLMY